MFSESMFNRHLIKIKLINIYCNTLAFIRQRTVFSHLDINIKDFFFSKRLSIDSILKFIFVSF